MSEEEVPDGVTIPPGEVRQIIDKTAGYVHRNGPSFEIRIREKERDNVKFAFLLDDDPYNAYYKWSLSQMHKGKNTQQIDDQPQHIRVSQQDEIPKPEDFKFLVNLPPVSARDLDVIRLCAQFVAKNGDNYVSALKGHVGNNVQFEFLVKGHSLYPVFEQYVKQYRYILENPQDIVKQASDGSANPYAVLDRAFARAEYTKKKAIEKADTEAAEMKDKMLYASIDWDTFTVVETIEFTEIDDVAELPVPMSLAELQYRSLEQKKANSLLEEAPPDYDPEEDVARAIVTVQQPVQSEVHGGDRAEETRSAPKGIKIRSAGDSRLKRQLQQQQQQQQYTASGERLLKCPLTGQLIPESKFAQHIKILLRDPKYKEERKRYEAKVSQTNLTTDEIYENIKSLASGERDQKRSKTVSWDGYKSSVKTVQGQANRMYTKQEIEKMRRERREQETKIGPH